MLVQECCVVFCSYTFKGYSKKILVCFQYTLGSAESFGMCHSIYRLDSFHQTVVCANGVWVTTVVVHYVVHLDMTTKSHHFVADGVLES